MEATVAIIHLERHTEWPSALRRTPRTPRTAARAITTLRVCALWALNYAVHYPNDILMYAAQTVLFA